MSTPAVTVPDVHTDALPASVPAALPAALLGAAAAGLLAWTTVLGRALPATYTVERWDLAWIGLDVALAGLFAATGWLVRRRDPLAPALALATATGLVADAWFDCSTAASADLPASLVMASLELAVAAALTAWAIRSSRSAH